MHIWTHLQPKSVGVTGLGVYPDGMVEHDALVGRLLGLLDSLGIADNTIVMYSTDNGAEKFSWPDGGTSPFRNEKASNWEGAYRVPGHDQAGRAPSSPAPCSTTSCRTRTGCPTLVAAAGNPTVKEQLLTGYDRGRQDLQGAPRRVQPDGLPQRQGRPIRARTSSISMMTDRWWGCGTTQYKIVFAEQRADGLDVWQDPFVPLRFPKLFNLRSDPFETADHESINYGKWRIEHAFVLVPAQAYVATVPRHVRGVPAAPEGRELLAGQRAGRAAEREPAEQLGVADGSGYRCGPPDSAARGTRASVDGRGAKRRGARVRLKPLQVHDDIAMGRLGGGPGKEPGRRQVRTKSRSHLCLQPLRQFDHLDTIFDECQLPSRR